MHKTFIFLLGLLSISCSDNRGFDYDPTYQAAFDSILDSRDMSGTVVVLDPQTKTYYSNDFELARTGFIPASTFKIPNAIIAMEASLITDPETILPWDGAARDLEIWERDMTFQEAFRTSCVPCFQEIARDIGAERMKGYLNKLRYGKMDVQNDVDQFWLRGSSRISPIEQIDFLARLHSKKLPILTSTREKILKMMEIEQQDSYRFGGKSGLFRDDDEIQGWFVGYLVEAQKIYYFALHAEPLDPARVDEFIPHREQAIRSALHAMGLIKN